MRNKNLFILSILAIILTILALILPMPASAIWCYQEFVNQSSSCGGVGTGKWIKTSGPDGTPFMDGDYSTHATVDFSAQTEAWQFNYTKPEGATSNSKLQFKSTWVDWAVQTLNFTIPQRCWDYSTTTLNFLLQAMGDRLYCQNGTANALVNSTGWEYLNHSGLSGYNEYYEEGMWWNLAWTEFKFSGKTAGRYSNQNISTLFNTTDLSVVDDYINSTYFIMEFNMGNNYANATQFYEVDSADLDSVQIEHIKLLSVADIKIYFRILDNANNPIKDATVISYQANNSATGNNVYELTNRRLTSASGITFMNFDSGKMTYLTVEKEGYALQYMVFNPSDLAEHNTESNPYFFSLGDNPLNTTDVAFALQKSYINMTDSTFRVSAYLPLDLDYSYSTSDNTTKVSITRDAYKIAYITLYNKSSYLVTNLDPLRLHIWDSTNNIEIGNATIMKDNTTYVTIPSVPTSATGVGYFGLLILIGCIAISGLLGILFPNQAIGYHIFYVASLISLFVSNALLGVAIIMTIHYGSRIALSFAER